MISNILPCLGRNVLIFCFLLAFLAGVIPACAQAQSIQPTGTIRGKVTVSASDDLTKELLSERSMYRYRAQGFQMEEPVQPYRLSEMAVVYIDSIGGDTAYPPPEVHPTLNQVQMMFRPLVLPVVVGTTVDFPNRDNLYHNVFSYSQAKEFDLGRYPKGHSRSVTFNKPGTVKVYCDIHTYMYATILVLENPCFAVPDEDGSYLIRNVRPGTYQVSCWYGRKKLSTATVTVRADQTSVANFTE